MAALPGRGRPRLRGREPRGPVQDHPWQRRQALRLRALTLTAHGKPRIHIIGAPGSGKSSAAAKLSRRLGVPAYDLDDLFWVSPYHVRAAPVARDRRLADLVARDGWIIEGAFHDWLGPSFDAADVIIELAPPLRVRQWRMIRRYATRKLGWAAPKRETALDLLRAIRWSYVYERRHRAEARAHIVARGRQLVACRTFEQVLAATRVPPRERRPG